MIKLKEIVRLKFENYSTRKIAQILQLSRNTLIRYLIAFQSKKLSFEELNNYSEEKLFAIVNTSDSQNESLEQRNYNELCKLFPGFELELKKVGVTREYLWCDYRSTNPNGYSYSQFCYHYQQWKKNSDITMHFEHKAGDKLFVDYTGKKLQIVNKSTGEIQELEVFIAILGASQLMYVEASCSQQKGDFLKSLANSLKYFGGVPLAIVPDNLKSAVTKPCKYEAEINSSLEDFAHHYQTTILPARSRKPRDKSLVENAVRIVYTRIFRDLNKQIFFNIEELNTELRKLLEQLNKRKLTNREHSRQELFDQLEKNVLKALPVFDYELKIYKFYKVQNNGHIRVTNDNHYYSVPYKYIGCKVKVAYSTTSVEIYSKYTRIAAHKRIQDFGYSTIKEHMASRHRYIAEWNPERFISWANKIGENTVKMISEILNSKQYPEQSYKSCSGILSFAKKLGHERLENACKRAVYYNNYGYRVIKNILERGVDKEFIPDNNKTVKTSQNHENVRGAQYYSQPTLF